MRILVQVCKEASVKIDGKIVSSIGQGELVLVGFKVGDDKSVVDKMIDKLLKLRIFKDENDKTNLNLKDYGGNILAVSQFTLYGNLKEGNRPSYNISLSADKAHELYDYFEMKVKEKWPQAQFGVFHADMEVSLINDGPSTYLVDSGELYE